MSSIRRTALAAAILCATAAAAIAADASRPPATRIEVVRDTLQGRLIEDPYRWLEDKDSPETRQWVRDQMAYTQQQLAAVPGREAVAATMAKYAKVDFRGVPTLRKGRAFFLARTAEQQQPVLMMRATPDGPDVSLVDPNLMSADHSTSVTLLDVCPDGGTIAFGVRKGGEDEVEVHVLDVDAHRELAVGLPKSRFFGFSIDADKKGAWYSKWEPKGSRVWYHRFGDDPAKDTKVFGDGLGPTEIPGVGLSDNGRWLVIAVYVGSSGDETHVYVRDAAKGGPFLSVTDTLKVKADVQVAGDQLVIETNWNAPNGRIFVADPRRPGPKYWKPVVPEQADAVIDQVAAVGGKLVVEYLKNVASESVVYGLDGRKLGAVDLPGIGSMAQVTGEWDGTEAFYSFSSYNRPPTVYRYDLAAGASRPWWTSSAKFDSDRYEVKQVWYPSRDGTKVPMFIVQRAGLALDGSHPVLLYGYGGFNVSETPGWSARVATWLDQGGVFASANLRGGGEFGENWHRAGMRAKKQNTFDDFIAAGEWLVGNGYCTPAKLAIFGGSNGGLLVGAAMTQRPELFGAVLCEVPLLDMLRYHRFLVARFWVPEYGSSEDPEQFRWLEAYSPYQKLVPGTKYPAVMFVSGDSDTRVDPCHARKMAARMQALNGERPVLLHYDVSSGHAGGKSVDKTIQDTADELQFLRGQLGMAPAAN